MTKFDVESHFSKLEKAIRTDDDIIDTIQQRRNTITKIVNQIYWKTRSDTNHSLFVGSYGRGTAIGFSDVDLLVELPPDAKKQFDEYLSNGQSSLLQNLKSELQNHYTKSSIKGDGQIVSIEFTDGIGFEILPAFATNDAYEYPDTHSGGSWKKTNPKLDQSILTQRNKEFHFIVKKFAKMVRAWRENANVKISGIAIDSLVYNFFESWNTGATSFACFDLLTKQFFDWIVSFFEENETLNSLDASFVISLDDDVESKSKSALERVKKANAFAEQNNKRDAEIEWQKVFGSKFPIIDDDNQKEKVRNSIYLSTPPISTRGTRTSIGDAADTEEFANDKWIFSPNMESIDIEVDLIMNGFVKRELKFFKSIPIRLNSKIEFSVPNIQGVKWYWKVRNVGSEAIKRNQIRGQIRHDGIRHTEPVNFKGNHYVEAYGISDNTVLYFGRVQVPLENE